jgi:YggT family protein
MPANIAILGGMRPKHTASNFWKVNRNTMFIVGYLFEALGHVIAMVLNIYMWIIIARAVLSWVNPDPHNPIVRFLYSATEPVLGALRRRVPLFFGGIDFAPMVVILAIVFLERFLVPTLFALARQFGGG